MWVFCKVFLELSFLVSFITSSTYIFQKLNFEEFLKFFYCNRVAMICILSAKVTVLLNSGISRFFTAFEKNYENVDNFYLIINGFIFNITRVISIFFIGSTNIIFQGDLILLENNGFMICLLLISASFKFAW